MVKVLHLEDSPKFSVEQDHTYVIFMMNGSDKHMWDTVAIPPKTMPSGTGTFLRKQQVTGNAREPF